MNYAAMWFLVFIGGQQYLGPLPQSSCQSAAAILINDGIVCKQSEAMIACPVAGMLGVYTSCPVFDFPKVTIK